MYKTHCIGWAVCILFSLIYTLTQENSGFIERISVQDGDGLTKDVTMVRLNIAFLPIIGLEFVIPVVYRFCESWSNAVMQELFKQLLQENDTQKGAEIAPQNKKKEKRRQSNKEIRRKRRHDKQNSCSNRCTRFFSCCLCGCCSKCVSKKNKKKIKQKKVHWEFDNDQDGNYKEEKENQTNDGKI